MRLLEWIIIAVIAALLVWCVYFTPGPAHGAPPVLPAAGRQTLTIRGSDTMVQLNASLAEAFMKHHPEVSVAVNGGGSGTGFAALINGTCDLGAASREIRPAERARMERGCSEIVVAWDALTVAVHPSNPLRYLNLKQLADIYTRRITDWRDLGGRPGPIVVLSRDNNSGTYAFFLEHVVQAGNPKAQFAPEVLMLPSSQAEVDELARNRNAIAYFGLGYLDRKKVAAVALGKTGDGPFILPAVTTVHAGTYPLARKLYYYAPVAAGSLRPHVRAFIDFAMSAEGQQIVASEGFVPLSARKR